jgi:class 3 adenylate cyclase
MPEVERKLAAILSADVVGYARLMAEDEAGMACEASAVRR